jgi:lysozyme
VNFDGDDQLARDLMGDEGRSGEQLASGFVHVAYPDPLSPLAVWLHAVKGRTLGDPHRPAHLSGDPWTIGYGHTGREVLEGLVWTEAQAREALDLDIARHNDALVGGLPWIVRLDPVRRRVLQNMVFSMGWDNPRTPVLEGLSAFTTFLGLVKVARYSEAADDGLHTRWARQVHGRAARLMEELRTGRYAAKAGG